ncbi:MAG: fibronectin type III domain-containing protein, partial [Verrucomicrobia bacterium]|nr:fibronectin type III domain-containing protein [Verrucomicrobiota bacterium]
ARLGLVAVAVMAISAATGWGQILTFDFDGLRGGEASAMSNANNANLFSSTITRGAGLTATNGDGWNQFNSTSWATTSIANAVSGNKYVEFTITPRAGFSGTGGTQIALRSSVDNYSSNLEGVKSVSDSISATTLSWISGFSGSSSSAVTYRLYSYVQNATGQGGPGGGSGNDIVVYGTFTAIPSAPTITSITPGNRQLSVAFTAGSDGGSSIMNYEYSTDGGTSWRYTSGTTSPLLITALSTDGSTALANGTSYNVQIRAVSMVGTGTATASTAATPRTTPGTPMILSVTPGNGQLTVSFGAPSSDGGSPITDYEYSINGGSSFTSRLSTSTTFVIGSLMNGSSYNVQVRAVNAAGRGTATSSWAGTPRTTPNAPSINYVTPGNKQLSVGFMAGSDGGSAITNYQYSTDGGTSWRTHTSTFSPILITTLSTDGTTALANGTSYNVQLRAVNAAGSGTATSSTAATPRTTPGAPTSLALTPGNGQLTASFFAPSDGGSPIT